MYTYILVLHVCVYTPDNTYNYVLRPPISCSRALVRSHGTVSEFTMVQWSVNKAPMNTNSSLWSIKQALGASRLTFLCAHASMRSLRHSW